MSSPATTVLLVTVRRPPASWNSAVEVLVRSHAGQRETITAVADYGGVLSHPRRNRWGQRQGAVDTRGRASHDIPDPDFRLLPLSSSFRQFDTWLLDLHCIVSSAWILPSVSTIRQFDHGHILLCVSVRRLWILPSQGNVMLSLSPFVLTTPPLLEEWLSSGKVSLIQAAIPGAILNE